MKFVAVRNSIIHLIVFSLILDPIHTVHAGKKFERPTAKEKQGIRVNREERSLEGGAEKNEENRLPIDPSSEAQSAIVPHSKRSSHLKKFKKQNLKKAISLWNNRLMGALDPDLITNFIAVYLKPSDLYSLARASKFLYYCSEKAARTSVAERYGIPQINNIPVGKITDPLSWTWVNSFVELNAPHYQETMKQLFLKNPKRLESFHEAILKIAESLPENRQAGETIRQSSRVLKHSQPTLPQPSFCDMSDGLLDGLGVVGVVSGGIGLFSLLGYLGCAYSDCLDDNGNVVFTSHVKCSLNGTNYVSSGLYLDHNCAVEIVTPIVVSLVGLSLLCLIIFTGMYFGRQHRNNNLSDRDLEAGKIIRELNKVFESLKLPIENPSSGIDLVPITQ